ncbi:MAG: tetratricopeptide repeat protein [Pyrinomonadaceae bacterium]
MQARRRCLIAVSAAVIAFFLCVPVFPQQAQASTKEQLILQIQQLMTERNLAGARQLLGEAAKRYPAEDAGFDNLLGIIEAQEGNTAAAESSFQRAIKSAPKFTGAYLNLGRLYQETSPIDPQAAPKALAVYRQVLQYDPDHGEANYQSAMLLMRQGAYRDSLDHLQRLPANVQQSAQALSVGCADYAGLGDSERANEAASRLLAHPDFSELDVRTIQSALATPGEHSALLIKLFEGLQKRQQLSPGMMRSLALAYERAGVLDKRATRWKNQ